MEIPISRASLRRVLFAAMALVVGAGIAVESLKATVGLGDYKILLPIFSLSYEQNVPTWYSSAILLTCALLLATVAAGARLREAPYVKHWWGLSAAFFYISLDETASFHEALGSWARLGGVLYFSWVVPAAIIVAVIGVAYLRFLAHLPKATRSRFILAGAIYVTGALVMELPLGYWTEREGSRNFVYAAIDAVEEGMEILGVSLFLLAILDYLGAQGHALSFAPKAAAEAPPEPPAPSEPPASEP
jgi:hypothetical protein